MVKHLQQRHLEVLIIIIYCILFCYGTQDERECHYWYRRFPATPSAVCYGTNQTTTVTLVCEVEYRAQNSSDSIEVRWYRSRDEETAGIEGEILNEVINKYQQYSDPRQVNQTFISQYGLGILRFNSSDRGYYWCQMVINNVSLSPSPYGHINGSQCTALDGICEIDQPICAQNTCAQYMAVKEANGCSLMKFSNISPTRTTTISQVVTSSITTLEIITLTESKFPVSDIATCFDITTVTMSNFPEKDIVTVTISSFPTKDIATVSFPTAEVASATVAGIILLALTIIIVSSIIYVKKHRSERKEHEVVIHHYAKIELNECEEANDISNPHYTEVRIATDQSHLPPTHKETTVANDSSEMGDSGLSKTEQQYPYSEAEKVARINYNHSDQIKSQDSHKIQTETDNISSEYAVVDKSKKTSRLQSNVSTATRADSAAMENNHYDRLKQDRSAKAIIASEEGKDQVREKSPSPTYAELSVREKIPKVSKCLTEIEVQQKDCELDSHEYAGVDQASGKITEGEPEVVEQHYYYSLENPEESCSDNKGKEEISNTGENEYNMPQFHHLVIHDKSIAPNTDEETDSELASVKEINAIPLDSHQEEVHTDKANS